MALNQINVSKDQSKYPFFELTAAKLTRCLESLMKYIMNILPSNISQEEQLNHPSNRR